MVQDGSSITSSHNRTTMKNKSEGALCTCASNLYIKIFFERDPYANIARLKLMLFLIKILRSEDCIYLILTVKEPIPSILSPQVFIC
jgi:hypothetical protein